MIRSLNRSSAVLVAAAIFACAAAAQPPSPAPPASPPPGAARPPQKAKNLKVLPQDTDLRTVMHQYEADLGVRCSFCHAPGDAITHRTDFASDANPTKDTARFMIQMTADLNNKYLEQMPMRRYADPITCGTCHRGQTHPSVFVAPPEAEGNRPPAMPAGSLPNASPSSSASGSNR